MKTNHTPGPWSLVGMLIEAPREQAICSMKPPHFNGYANAEANARLIASAPDLLAACQNAANVLAALATGHLESIDRDSPALAQLRAAIAKAKGTDAKP